MNNKILVFKSRQLSYGSSQYFLNVICKEFMRNGFTVEYCPINSVEDNQELLMKYVGQSFQMIFDINSILPLAKVDEENYLDLIDAPFYNFIVDHPMHLHERINVPLKNYHVICLDQFHAEYIRKFYPQIKDVVIMPYAGFAADIQVNYKERQHNIAFPATYMPLEYYWRRIEQQSKKYMKLTIALIDLLSVSDDMTLDLAYSQIKKDESIEDCYNKFNETSQLRNIDRFIRGYFREKAMNELLKAQIQIDVIGMNWELYQGKNKKYLNITMPMDYRSMLEFLSNSKVVFNVQPLFMDGPHDRVMNAFMNGAVAFSDGCNFLKNQFEEGNDLVLYQRSHMEFIPDILGTLFSDHGRMETMASKAYQKASQFHTWEQRIHNLFDQEKLYLNRI